MPSAAGIRSSYSLPYPRPPDMIRFTIPPRISLWVFFSVSLCLCGSFLPPLYAAKVKVWHHHSAGHYDKAQFKQALVRSDGTLRLSRQLKPLANLDAMHVWDVIEDKDG